MLERLRRLFAPSLFEDEEKTRTAQILNSIGWVAFAAVFLLGVYYFITGGLLSDSSRVFFPGILLIILATQVLIRFGYVRPAGIFLIVFTWLALTYQAWQSNGLRDAAVLAYPIIILLSALLLGWREGVTIGLSSLAALWYFAVQEARGAHRFRMDTLYHFAGDLTVIFVISSVLIYILIQRLNRSLTDARVELRERLKAEEKLQLQAQYLTALHDTTFGLLDRLELTPLLESILNRTSELLETPHVGVEFVLPDGSALRQEMGKGIYAEWNGALTHKGVGVTGMIWERGETILVNDYETWEGRNPEALGIGLYAVAGAPLKTGDTTLGVLLVATTEPGHRISNEQALLLERLAALASLAIDNARLHEESRKEIAERKLIEQDLRASDERFRKVFNNSQIAITIVTLEEGMFLEANDAFWRLSGLTPEKALGRTSLELHTWNNPAERESFVKRLVEKGSLQGVEVNFPAGDREERASLGYYELIAIKNKPCILCMFYDVTEQKQAQDALRNAEARTRAILNSIPDMIFEISSDGIILEFVPSPDIPALAPPSEAIGRNVRETMPPEIAEQAMFAIRRAIESGQMHIFEYGLPPGEEVQFFEARVIQATPVSAIIMVRDISQRKWVETEREKLIDELENKNAELERFTYTVSHDLKSPVITIRGFLGFLEQDAHSGNLSRLRSDIKRISDATDKMQSLLNELLDLSRVGRLINPSRTTPFNEIVAEALDLVHGQTEANRVRVRVQENLPAVHGDHPRLVEALQNLIDNAAKFIREEPQIEIGQKGEENGMPVFFVRDNGIGIPLEHHDRIFGLFNKLDADSEGTGIGLALVKRIIEVHKGRIWVESEPGKGSAFFFTLPTAPPAGPGP